MNDMKILKIFVALILSLIGWDSAFGQASTVSDAEFQSLCMIDSISSSVQIYFQRRVSMINPAQYTDHTQNYSGSYTVVGTAKPCNYQDVVKECWLKQQTVSYINYVYSSDASVGTEDMWIVDWIYVESKSVSSFADAQTPLVNLGHVPLAYPYGNSQREADRFSNDLKEWLDCMGVCYKDDAPNETIATPTGVGTPYTTLRGLRVSATVYGIQFVNMYYSRNPLDPSNDIILRSGTKTTGLNYLCDLPFDLYRRVADGTQAWGINYKGVIEYPPYTGLLTKVACEFADNRRDDCNRPSGSNELWIAAVDTSICNYYVSITANEDINGVYLRGVNVIGSTYQPDGGGGTGYSVQDLTDTLNDYILNKFAMGEFAINNRNGLTYGWKITGKWLNYTFDSVTTTFPHTFYPTINGCHNYKSYTVRRNELGGIVSCLDENGKRSYLPEHAIKVNPGDENAIFDCMNSNRYGSEILNTGNKTFDLSKYHYFSYSALAGSGTMITIDTKDRNNSSTTMNVERGYNEGVTAETPCDYLKGTIKITNTSGGVVKISYLW